MISELAFLHILRAWKRARLTSGSEALGYPRENILEKALKGRTTGRTPQPDEEPTDAEVMQLIVARMPDEIRICFEACHLALVGGQRLNGTPHHMRANILGIPKSTYWHRVNAGKRFSMDWLSDRLDTLD